jgi:hypothetical protein
MPTSGGYRVSITSAGRTHPPLQCHGFGCTSATLIKAHLVPQAFGRAIKSIHGPNTRVSERVVSRKTQHGLFDPDILCADCDGYLNTKYDDPAAKFINRFSFGPGELDLSRSHFEKPNVDGDLLCEFVLSVLWRCSISQLFEVSNINLGPYVNLAREILWGHRSLTDLPAFKLMVQRYHPSPGIDKMYSMPMPVVAAVAGGQWHGYVFVLRGFRFMITLDPRPFPPEYDSYLLNGNTTLRGSLIDFRITHEAQQIRELSALHNLSRS